MKCNRICDFCSEPIRVLYGLEIMKYPEGKNNVVTRIQEKDCCRKCALQWEKEINRKLKIADLKKKEKKQ